MFQFSIDFLLTLRMVKCVSRYTYIITWIIVLYMFKVKITWSIEWYGIARSCPIQNTFITETDSIFFVYFVQNLTTLPHLNGLVNTPGDYKRTSSMEVYWCAEMRMSVQPEINIILHNKWPVVYLWLGWFYKDDYAFLRVCVKNNSIPFAATPMTHVPDSQSFVITSRKKVLKNKK